MAGKDPRSLLPDPETARAVVLDPDTRARLGPIAALPVGAAGAALLRDVFFALLDAWQPELVCDIGANRGETAARAKELCPGAAVHGFEANPDIHAAGAGAMAAARVVWHHAAVTDRAGPVSIHIPRRLSEAYFEGRIYDVDLPEGPMTGKGSLLRRTEEAEYTVVEVPGFRLDDLFSGSERAMLWIDVEGCAPQVLAGATGVLARSDAVLIEVEAHAFWEAPASVSTVLDALRASGFVPLLRDREYGTAQFNVLAVRETALSDLDLDAISRLCATGQIPPKGLLRPQVTPNAAPSRVDRRVPVVIPCFENPSFCRQIAAQIDAFDDLRVILVDNGSVSAGMQTYLAAAETDAQVIRLGQNLGPHLSVFRGPVWDALPRVFCVTDPDLAFHPMLPRDFLDQLAQVADAQGVGKAGFALDISDRASMHSRLYDISGTDYHIWDWEVQFWSDPVGETPGGDTVFRAPIDTTFARYDRDRFNPETDLLSAVRVAGRFTARHLPWYATPVMTPAEEAHYRARQTHSFYLPSSGQEV